MKKVFTSSGTLWFFFIAMMMMFVSQSAMAEYVRLTALNGTGGTGGEGYPKLVDTYDGRNGRNGTKWGQRTNFGEGGEAWIIVKAEKAFSPQNYFLVTANDTNGAQGRQWTGWNIYGANFENDAAAVKDAAAWTLIDQREDADLTMQNFGVTQFTLDTDPDNLQHGSGVAYDGTPYQYYMIEVTSMKTDGQYLQMGEFGFGTYADFETWLEIQAADPTKPVTYRVLAGSPAGYTNEGYGNLFDGNSGTKWCCSITNREKGATEGGAYLIIKASRPMTVTYYSLTTANDSRNSNRNWKQWQIYGMTASSDAAVTRDAAGWVLLDEKENIGAEQLPNENYAQAFFIPSVENTTAYKYYKLELDRVWGGEVGEGHTMQMSEFAFGDEITLNIERNAVIENLAFDPTVFAEKALLDEMEALIASIEACGGPVELGNLNAQAIAKKNEITTSIKRYAELVTARGQALIQLNDNNVVDAAVAYVQGWINETEAIAPNDDYPFGNFAYIKANRQLTGDEAFAEAKRFTNFVMNNLKQVDEPIGDIGYIFIEGTTDNWQPTESPAELIDGKSGINGTEGTKWGTATSGDRYLIFKSETPIKPTYYGLVTGSDTGTYTDRNWKNWKIFASNDSIGKNDNRWVLIDEKNNVGTDVLKTTSLFESYINLSIGCAVPYKYFKIEVYHEGGMQMNEFHFYNLGDLQDYRESFIDEFADFEPDAEPAYKGYSDEFKDKYEELQTCVNAPDVMGIRNELAALQDTIGVSIEKYALYEEMVEELKSMSPTESLQPWFDGYTTSNAAPSNMYRRGTHDYIIENLSLDNNAMGNVQYLYDSSDSKDDNAKIYYDKYKYQPGYGEIGYIENMIAAINDGRYILVEGSTDEQWGDGFHGNLIDAYFLNDTTVVGDTLIKVDNKDVTYQLRRVKLGTKWGGNAKGNNTFNNTYIIFRTPEPTNPFFYTLTTGDDTANNQNRNWGTWKIYGANFECDGDATKDAEGWTLIDEKVDIKKDRLHPVNCEASYFGFSSETTTQYTYYKVVVTKAFSGSQIQMNDLHFGTPEEFENIKAEYIAKANEFDYEVVAEQTLIDQYEQAINDIRDCMNMEVLFRANYAIEELQEQIKASAAAYERYATAVEAAKTYLSENALSDCEAKAAFVNYLNGEATEGPSETYPNGVAAYILEEHVLADSVVLDEIEFLESLKLAAVAAGYGKGMDITSLIVNHTFKNAGETLQDEEGNNVGRKAEGWDGYIFRTNTATETDVYAAEFCNYLAKFDVSQTLTGMKNGFYKVTLNAAYRGNGDGRLLSYAYAPLAYANGVQTFIPAIREEAITEEEEAWNGYAADRVIYYFDENQDSIFVGYGMWGCEGAANAFSKGKYAITLVTEVTDSTLTFGVKNEYGTKGNEWTAVGNFGLWYLGDTVDDAADALAEAAEYNAARIGTLTELYVPDVEAEVYSDAPGFSAAQKTALLENSGVATLEAAKTIGDTMEAIAETKLAYAALFEASAKVYDKWFNFGSPDAMQMETEVYEIWDNMTEGVYDAASALASAEALYASYPDYLEVVEYNENVYVEQSEEEAFNYFVGTVGRNPSVLMGGNFYDALTEDEVIFAFEYSSTEELANSRFFIGKDADDTQAMDIAIAAAEELTQVYIDLSKAVKEWGFGKVDDVIRWRFASGECEVEVGIRHPRMITKAQMRAEGGSPLNGMTGDTNGDDKVDIADAQTILNFIADEDNSAIADVNGDGKVDVADYQSVLNIIADQ